LFFAEALKHHSFAMSRHAATLMPFVADHGNVVATDLNP
jgi:hypothetical protein